MSETSAPAPADDLDALATRVYAALGAGDVADARALVAGRKGTCFGVGVTQRRDGGFIIHGGRIALRVDAKGTIESHAVESSCVAYADEQVAVLDVEGNPGDHTFVMTGAVAEPVSLTGHAQSVLASSEWVVVANGDHEYVAWPRGAAKVLRAAYPDDPDDAPETALLEPRLAGRYFVTRSSSAITLHRPDGRDVVVTGCKGILLAAVSVPGGVALHVSPTIDSSNTKLCMVADNGRTRRVTALGHAVCGLRTAGPCPWELRAVTSQLVVFSSHRGGVLIVDAKTAAKLPYRGEPNGQFPATYSSCGDAVCVETSASDAGEAGWMKVADGRVTYQSGPPRNADVASALKDRWCVDGDLLLPCQP